MPRRTIPGDGKKVALNMRTTAALRAKIDKAAGKSGRSLVQEVEHRVERSFYQDELTGIRADLAGINVALDDVAASHDAICKLLVMLGCEGETNLALLRKVLKQNGAQAHG